MVSGADTVLQLYHVCSNVRVVESSHSRAGGQRQGTEGQGLRAQHRGPRIFRALNRPADGISQMGQMLDHAADESTELRRIRTGM